MGAFTNAGKLIQLILRRDRIKLPLWIIGLGLIFIGTVSGVTEIYSDEKERMVYAATSAVSGAAIAFNGPVMGPSMGSVAFTETFTFLTIFVALMSTLLVVRHTRQNEELGRTELIGAAVVGRYAQLTAALVVAVGANMIVGAFVAIAYIMFDLPVDGALLAGTGMAAVGIAFAAIAAITAQLTASARLANGLAAGSIGAAFLVRAIGDMQGTVQPGGMDVTSGWLSWLSPIGIARSARPFVDNHWWVLGILALITIAFVGAAYWLLNKRDIGAGLLAQRRGRANARPSLLSSLGLAWRLQRSLLLGWALGLAVLAIALGSTTHEIEKFASSSEQLKEVVLQLGGTQNLVDGFLAFSMLLFGVAASAYGIQALLRLRSEETSTHAELILAGKVGRRSWALSHIVVVLAGIVGLMLLTGGITGFVYGLIVGNMGQHIADLLVATVAYLPAAFIFCGFAVLLFGLVPRLAIGAAWFAFAITYLIVQFGEMLKLPDWFKNISPFSHVPMAPAEDITIAPLAVMVLVASVLFALGLMAFRRRDITTA